MCCTYAEQQYTLLQICTLFEGPDDLDIVLGVVLEVVLGVVLEVALAAILDVVFDIGLWDAFLNLSRMTRI